MSYFYGLRDERSSETNPWCSTRAALIAHIDAWGARLAEGAAKDAERYRWLRDKARHEWDERLFVTDDGHKDYYAPNGIYEDELDAAIDKAIAAAPKPEGACGS